MAEIISGKNAVLEALKGGLPINKVWVAENIDEHFAGAILRLARERGIPVRRLPKARLTQLAGPDHRGVAAEAASVEYAALADILAAAELAQQPPLILLLDGVEDPHNLGAIIRSAHCLGAHGVVIAKHRSAQLNQTVLRTSAGAAALLPVARVANLNQALQQLKDAGCWTVAVDMGGDDLWSGDLGGPLALVLGGEGSGISPLLKSNCDFCLSIPMSRGEIGSLNVSNAAAIVLAAAARQLRG
ncbi:MAG: 23S rRNA (guanosine(2251)-2'-O)-methyltransferase RlmB [Clostridia bacterium]|nr:23S rRNA (guanosine(2251)-2'-O)-methyltransferase RlmB [Clostridia bacterium]